MFEKEIYEYYYDRPAKSDAFFNSSSILRWIFMVDYDWIRVIMDFVLIKVHTCLCRCNSQELYIINWHGTKLNYKV